MLDCLGPMLSYVLALQINADKMRAALTDDMLATDLADYLVRKGVSSFPNQFISKSD
jgi:argininosuccinate lyase